MISDYTILGAAGEPVKISFGRGTIKQAYDDRTVGGVNFGYDEEHDFGAIFIEGQLYSPRVLDIELSDNDNGTKNIKILYVDTEGYVQEKSLGGLIAWMASLDRYNVVTKAMFDGLYDEGYEFPDNEMKFTATSHSAQIRASSTGYEITVLNNENAVETNIALRDAELFQKSIVHMKIYIKTKSGVEFGPGEMCGDVTNKDGIGIVDTSSFYDAKNVPPGESYTFSVTVSGTPDVSDIVSIAMTQRILPTLNEFKVQIIYQG